MIFRGSAGRAALVAGAVLCACAALSACKNQQAAAGEGNALAVTSADLARAETARVGALVRLNARGVAEMRSKDADGEHFDQGDLDLRWSEPQGLAVKLSKLGDTWVWIGADATSWWVFELKSNPTRLHTGPLAGAHAGLAPAFPWLMGLRPLLPAAGAEPELIKDSLRVKIAVPAGALPEGAVLRASFDPKTLIPTLTELTLRDGSVWRAGFAEWMSVETLGQAQGAWPRIPKRAQAVTGLDDRWSMVRISLDSARSDPETTDRPALYDLAGLRAKFAPQQVETEQ